MIHFVILLLAPEDKICTLLLRCNFRLNFIAHFTVRKNRKKIFSCANSLSAIYISAFFIVTYLLTPSP